MTSESFMSAISELAVYNSRYNLCDKENVTALLFYDKIWI